MKPRGLAAIKNLSTLQWALLLSILLHATLLSIRFVNPDNLKRIFEDHTLDVILVNAKANDSQEPPEKAQAIAQHTLTGGGESDEKRIASTPLPPASVDAPGDSAIEENQRQISRMIEQQEQLLAQVRAQLAALPQAAPQETPNDAEAQAQEARRQKLQNLLAAIEKRVEEENSRPRKRYLSPATLGATYAPYYDDMRLKIEATGTANFPHVAGRKLYGELLMALLVNHDGRILDARVVRSSGDRALDRLAEAIAQKAAPFGPFTAAMRQDTDQFDVTALFRFTREQRLETTLHADVLTPKKDKAP